LVYPLTKEKTMTQNTSPQFPQEELTPAEQEELKTMKLRKTSEQLVELQADLISFLKSVDERIDNVVHAARQQVNLLMSLSRKKDE